VEVAIYINRHVFVWLSPGQNVSAGRNASSEKFFGWLIFKQDLHFCVKIQVFEAFLGLIFAGVFGGQKRFNEDRFHFRSWRQLWRARRRAQ
jgi:hypothetical protein